jgi:hypothetical protein
MVKQMFGKKKEVLPQPPEPPKETEVVKVVGKAKLAQKDPTLAEKLLIEFEANYGSISDDEETRLLFAIYAETRLNRDILLQILAKA